MEALFIPTGLGFIIGLVLGMLGGGGSILTVPVLVYVVGQTPQVAVTASLMIVGTNSFIGAFFHRAQGTLNWNVAIFFGGTGMVFAYLSAGLSSLFSPTALLVMFASLMFIVGFIMLNRPDMATVDGDKERDWKMVVVAGAGIGILTGLLGVGGGFLIVPALVMLVGLPMRQAVGTSLIIIAMNSLAGLMGHLGDTHIDLNLIAIFAVSGIVGTFAGTKIAQHIANTLLQRVFATFIMGLSVLLLIDNLPQML